MAKRPIDQNAAPEEFPQVAPRDLHPTSDIRFVMLEIGKLTTQVNRLIDDVGNQGTKIDTVCHQVTFVKGATWVIGGLMAVLVLVIGAYFSGRVSISLNPQAPQTSQAQQAAGDAAVVKEQGN